MGKDNERRDLLYGFTVGVSVHAQHSLQAGYIRQDALRSVGADAHTVLLAWAMRF